MAVIHVKIDQVLEDRGISRYRLAEEARDTTTLSSSTIYGIIRGQFLPRFETLATVMELIERLSGKPVELLDVLEYDRHGIAPEPQPQPKRDPEKGRAAQAAREERLAKRDHEYAYLMEYGSIVPNVTTVKRDPLAQPLPTTQPIPAAQPQSGTMGTVTDDRPEESDDWAAPPPDAPQRTSKAKRRN